jgi:SAM-dependent methyltransferase
LSETLEDRSVLYEDRGRAESFGADAELYDRARPSYPGELVDHLLTGRVTSVLDVGCGTGIAGSLFQARGCTVLGVEPDMRMALVARGRGLRVEIATFEDWPAHDRRFDLLICGQAWHWVEPDAGASKAATVLARGGRLAVFWNIGRLPPAIGAALDAIYSRLEPTLARQSILLGNTDDRVRATSDALARTGRFTPPHLTTFSWARRYRTEQWREHLLTHSDHRTLSATRRSSLLDSVGQAIDRLGGGFEVVYETHLVSAQLG